MNVTPGREEIKQALEDTPTSSNPCILSLSCELLADLDTPVSAFYKLCENKPYSFLLESVEGNEKIGRYSIIGTEPILIFISKANKTYLENKVENQVTRLDDNPFVALKKILKSIDLLDNNHTDFLGFVGYFGYENIRFIEPKVNLLPAIQTPDVCLIFPGKTVIFDHVEHKVKLIVNLYTKNKNESITKYSELERKLENFTINFTTPKIIKPLSLNLDKRNKEVSYKSNFKKEEFIGIIEKAKKYISCGDIFQVVLSQKFQVHIPYNGLLLYRVLRSINPSPYLFYLHYKDFEIAGSSPEVMVKCERKGLNRIATLRPIAGTYPRGKDENEDSQNMTKLLTDPKEKAEHLMLVDLARNDLGRTCEVGSINLKEFMVLEKYSHVIHLVSQVEGTLKKDKTSIDLLSACFPAGTLSGAPKVRAMEIINELEKNERGPYGGCIGFFSLNNTINTAMTIRTFLIYKDYIEIQAGAGIVSDSLAEKEYEETIRKGVALLKAMNI